MKLSTKGRYSTRLMIDLALNGAKGPVLLKDIARRQDISEKYLGHLVPLLKSAGLINATRGANGGFTLAKPAATITLKDIVVAVEGPVSLIDDSKETLSGFWARATDAILGTLESFSLAAIAEEQKNKAEGNNYVI
ncbi:MAG: Rrf2 family transcriptional regulator [Candidatus Omnitrophica bacterium]|nr:Rrf2 family transcriptional regulator [Candidatus Omnitrophota bacterium]